MSGHRRHLQVGRDGASQVVFECPSHSGGIGNFQVALATEEDGCCSHAFR